MLEAMDWAEKNVQLNASKAPHEFFAVDTFDYLKNMKEQYDIIILDPPAFAKSMSARHNAIMAYKRLNALAIKKIEPKGIIFTFSCSQVVDKFSFTSAVLAAAIESGRQVSILHQMSQPADHPVNIYHPEGEYLKGLVLFVE